MFSFPSKPGSGRGHCRMRRAVSWENERVGVGPAEPTRSLDVYKSGVLDPVICHHLVSVYGAAGGGLRVDLMVASRFRIGQIIIPKERVHYAQDRSGAGERHWVPLVASRAI